MGVYQFRSDERFLKAAKVTLPLTFPRTEGIISRLALSTDSAASLFERAPLARALVQLAKLPIASPGPFDMINYYGPAGTIDRFSLSDLVLKDLEFAMTRLKDKIVFVGYQNTLRGRVPGADLQKDEYRVSASDEPMFGVEIHAHVAGNLMDGSWLKRLPLVTEVSCLYVASLIIAVLGIALSPEKAIIAIAVLITMAIGAAYWAFAYRHFIFPSVGALMVAGLVTAVGSALFHYLNIKGFKKYIRRTFSFEMDREL
jgi:CHASE2 domain-containing sensor protein